MDFLTEAQNYFATLATLSNDPAEREMAEQAARTIKAQTKQIQDETENMEADYA